MEAIVFGELRFITSRKNYLDCNSNTHKVNKTNVLVANNLDLIDQAKAAQIMSQMFVQSTQINVPTSIALAYGESNLSGNRPRFAPTDL